MNRRKLLRRTVVANGTKRHFAAPQQTVAFGVIADIGSMPAMSAFDPKRIFQLFSRHPPWCIFVGADLAPNDLDVTAQIIQLVGKG